MSVFRYVSPILWIFLGLAIVVAIVVPIFRHGVGQVISNIILNVAFSFIASFIFYTVVVLPPRAQEHEAAAPYMSRQIVMLRGDVDAVCREAARASGRKLPAEWTFNRGEVADIFNAARLRAPVNMFFPALLNFEWVM
jgi:hypothetical protein